MKAIIKVDVPEFQIGQEVTVYYRDTMCIKGVCEKEDERTTGKWILTKRNGILCGVCHSGFRRMPTLEGKPMFNYCPLCGAKMEGADNE